MIDENINEDLEAQDLSQDVLAFDAANQVLVDDEKPRKKRKSRWAHVTEEENVGRLDYKYDDIVDFEKQLKNLREQLKSGAVKWESLSEKEKEGLKTLEQNLKLKEVKVTPKKSDYKEYLTNRLTGGLTKQQKKISDAGYFGDKDFWENIAYASGGQIGVPETYKPVRKSALGLPDVPLTDREISLMRDPQTGTDASGKERTLRVGEIFYDEASNTYQKWQLKDVKDDAEYMPTEFIGVPLEDAKTVAKLNKENRTQASLSTSGQIYASENGKQYVVENGFWKVKNPGDAYYYFITDPKSIKNVNSYFGQNLPVPDKTKSSELISLNNIDREFVNDVYKTFSNDDEISDWAGLKTEEGFLGTFDDKSSQYETQSKIKSFLSKYGSDYNIMIKADNPYLDQMTGGFTDRFGMTERSITIQTKRGTKRFYIDDDNLIPDIQNFLIANAKPSYTGEAPVKKETKPDKELSLLDPKKWEKEGQIVQPKEGFKISSPDVYNFDQAIISDNTKVYNYFNEINRIEKEKLVAEEKIYGPNAKFLSAEAKEKILLEKNKPILDKERQQLLQIVGNKNLQAATEYITAPNFTPSSYSKDVANALKAENNSIKKKLEDFKKNQSLFAEKQDLITQMGKDAADIKNLALQYKNLISKGEISVGDAEKILLQKQAEFNERYSFVNEKYLQDLQNEQSKLIKDADELSNSASAIELISSNAEYAAGIAMMKSKDQGSFMGGLLKSIVGGIVDIPGFVFGVLGDIEDVGTGAKGKASAGKTSRDAFSGLTGFLVGAGTSEEYEADANLLYKATTGLARSAVQSAVGGNFALFGGGYNEMATQLDKTDMTAAEKILASSIYGTVSMALEKYGLDEIFGKGGMGSSISRYIMKRTVQNLTKDMSKEAVEALVTNEIKLFIADKGIKIAAAGFAEGFTESLQTGAEYGTKATIEAIRGETMFKDAAGNDAVTWRNLGKDALESFVVGAVGGHGVSLISQSASVVSRGMNALRTKEEREALVAAARAAGMDELVVANLQASLLSGKYSKKTAQSILENFKIIKQKVNTIPKEMPIREQAVALDLMLERDALNSQIEGVDPALAAPSIERVKEINETLKQIGYAVQESSTESVLQRQQEGTGETGGGREGVEPVVQGKEVAQEGEATAETKAEEVVPVAPTPVPGEKATIADVDIIYPTEPQAEERRGVRSTNEYVEKASESLPVEDVETLAKELEGDFGLLTAENPMAQPLTEEENKKLNEKAVEWLSERGYNPRPVTGKYGQAENSFFVPGLKRQDAIDFAKQFNQEAVAHSDGLVYQDGSMNPRVKADDNLSFTESYSPESDFVSVVNTKDGLKTFSIGYDFGQKVMPEKQAAPTQVAPEVTITPETNQTITERINNETDAKKKKVFIAVQKVLSAIPNARIILHENTDSFVDGVAKSANTTKEDAKNQGANTFRGAYVNGDVHINLETAGVTTVFHEAFHDLLAKKGMDNNALLDMAKGLKSVISDKALKQRLDEFISNYEEGDRAEEYTAELGAIMAEAQKELSTTKFQQFKTLINKIAKKLGLPVVFSSAATAQDAVDFMNSMSGKLGKGEQIEGIEPGDGGEVGTFNIPKIKADKSRSVSEDPRDFIRKFVEDIDIREFNGKKFITNMYDYTNAGETDLGNGLSIFMLGGKNYVPLMMELNGKKIGDVSNLAAFNTKEQAETFIRNSELGGANLFAPHAGTLKQSWQFQQHTFAELFNLVLDNGILKPKELIAVFNDTIKDNKSNKDQFKQFAEKYGENIKNFNSFESDPKKIIDLLDIKNNYSPKLRKALNNAIAANKKFQKAIGINNMDEFYKKIMDLLNEGMTGGEIMNIVEFDPTTFEIVETKPNNTDHHPSFGFTLLAKINGIYQPTELIKSVDITDSYTKYNKGGEEVSRKADEPKFEAKNVSSSAGAIPKTAEFNPKKIKAQIIGKNANLSQNVRDNLQVARDMENSGKSVKDIRIATGWERGADNKWRYEIPDNIEFFKDTIKTVREILYSYKNVDDISQKANYFLPEELLNLYPKLKNITIQFNKNGDEEKGYYDPVNNVINVNLGVYPENTIYTLLHEIQHAIQGIEGFAKGTSINQTKYLSIEKLINEIETGDDAIIYYKLQSLLEKSKIDKVHDLLNKYSIKKYNKKIDRSAYDLYMKYSGEVESRNVEKRMKMTPEERRQTTLQETEDIAREDQIIFFNEEGRPSKIKAQKVLPESVEKRLTEDGNGNYVFHHYSSSKRDSIKPTTGDGSFMVSKEEASALASVNGVAQYYAMADQKEQGTGNVQHTVLVPMDEVYYLQEDKLNLYDKAKEEFQKARPGQAFNPNYQAAWIGKVANDMGYKMLVSEWRNGELRAQTTLELKPEVNNIEMKPREKVTFNVGDKVNVFGDDAVVTEVNGDIVSYKGDRSSGSINVVRSKQSIKKISSIKAQKQSKEDAIQDAKDKYELSVEKRGKDHKTGVTAAIADLQKSDWYAKADDTQRENAVREIKKFFGEKLKSAPSVAKITGKTKDTAVVSDLAAAIRDQIKLEAKAAREATKDINQRRKELGIAIKNVIKNYKGKISEKQLSAINDRISKVNLLNEETVDRVIDYVDKVMKDADYKEKINKAKSARATIKKLKKDSNRQAEVRAMATVFASIDPDLVEDIDEYMAIAEQVKNALKPTSLSISNTTKFSDIYSYVDQYLEGQENIKKERLLSNNPSLVEQGIIDKSMSLKDIESKIRRINEQKNKLNKATNSEELKDNLKGEINSLKDILKAMVFGYNPITNERVEMTDRIKQVIKEISSLDVDDMTTEQMIALVESLNNFVKNGTIGGLDAAHKTYVGIKNANDLKRKGFVARQLKAYFSPMLGRLLGFEGMSLNELFTRLFGGVTRGNEFMEKSGVAGVVMGVNKAKKMSNAYQELYANTFKNIKGFFDQENVYERGVLAFVYRTNSIKPEEANKEFNRRIDLLLESYESLKNGTAEEQKMAEVYKKVFDRLNIESRDMSVIESNAKQFNIAGAAWWMGTWENHYQDLYDVSLSIYNTDLGSDFYYTSDRLSKLSESTGESIDITNISERGSSFLINTENEEITDKSKAGVLIASTYPATLKDKGRYVNLNFDINQSQALSGALVDIETAGAIRQVDAFISSDSFKSIIPSSSDRSLVVNRINKYIRRSKNKLLVPKDYARVIDKVINEAGRFGTTMALGGVFQFILQTFSVGINTLIQAGKYTQLYTGKSFNDWMNSTGTPTANRGVESVTSIENKMNAIDPVKSTLQQVARQYQKLTQVYMRTFLSKPDVFVARAAWKSYYLKYLSDNGYDTKKINWDTWNDTIKEEGIQDLHKKAMLFAENMVSRQQNVSDERLAGETFASEDGLRKAIRKILLPFAGFSVNQRMRLANDIITLTSAINVASKEDIKIAGRSLVGTVAEQATFNFIKYQVGKLIYYGAMSILGYGDDDEDEEEAKKRNRNALKYPIKSFIGDMASPAPFLDDFVVWAIDKGIKPFMEPSESEINDAVNEENNIRINALGKYKMTEDEKEEFIKKYKEDNTFSLESFKNDTGKYGLISVGSDAYEALYESLKMNDGKYTEEFQGKETEKYLTKDQIESQKIFSALKLFHFIGVLPREANQLADKGTRKIKQNSLTKNQYESYKEFKKEFKREPKPYEIDIIKSTPYVIKEGYTEGSNQKMLENIYNIDQLGGLSNQQGKVYAKLMSTGIEVTPQVYKLIQKGKTVEQIRKFIISN
jgi:hypothetical protein